MMKKKNIIQRVVDFFEKDIWKISTVGKRPVFTFLVRQGRILFIAVRGFYKDKIQLRASALSFYTMLSIVPILAMFFAIAQGFGLDETLSSLLKEKFHGQQEILKVLLEFVDKYLGHINSGYIAGIGLVMLFWSVMKVLGNIEGSFNNIWQIKKSRMITRKFTDYLSLLVIAPLLLIISSSFNVSQLTSLSDSIPFLHYLDTVLKVMITLLSYTLIWFVFTLIYIVVPNTKVKFVPALIGGIIGGTLFQLLQWGYMNFQSLLSGYGAVYGTFAALPLFMMWLEFSWLIVLLGAEISFAYQNASQYEQEAEEQQISPQNRRVLVLMLTQKITRNFTEGLQPLDAADLARELGIPVRIVRKLIYDLLNAHIIIETLIPDSREVAYQPALDPARITISYVIDKLDKQGQQVQFERESQEFDKLNDIVESFYENIRNSPNNTALSKI
jgi:membrane protein